jgi:hypothetical protein
METEEYSIEREYRGAERKLVVNVIDALNLPWRRAPRNADTSNQFRRECCPFIEISLIDIETKKVVDSLHFQTKRERCKEDDHEKEFANKLKRLGGNMKLARKESTITEQRHSQPITGASASWNETFTFNPRPQVFWVS